MIALNPPACISGRLASTTDPAILEQRRQWIRDRMTDNHALPVDRSMSNPFENPGVYIWRGKTYFGIRAVARAHGVSRKTVAYHLDTHGDLSRLGRGKARPGCQNAAKRTAIFGREFPSRVAAARHFGISISQFNRWTRPDASAAMRDMLLAAMMRAEAGRAQA